MSRRRAAIRLIGGIHEQTPLSKDERSVILVNLIFGKKFTFGKTLNTWTYKDTFCTAEEVRVRI